MKTNFWKFAALLALGLAAVVACEKDSEPEKIAPVFPSEVIEQNVEAGATVELTFEANLDDWKLKISPNESNRCWIDDNGIDVSSVEGDAGTHTYVVEFSEDEYFDQNVVYEVILEMGGQSKVIAKLTRLAINRTMDVYVAEKTDWGFKATYVAEKATSLELVTFEGDATYTQRIKVLANFNWNLSLPEWCEGQIKGAAEETKPASLSGTAGQTVEIELVGKLTADVKAGASDFARFIDAADNTKSDQLALTLPAFENRLEVTTPNTMEFGGDGSADGMAVGYILGMDGFVVRALEWDAEGGYHICHSYANWVTVNFANASEGEDIFVQKSFTLGVEVNNGAARCADIFVFPASMAETDALSICDVDDLNCGIKPEYEKYCIGRLSQGGKIVSYISEYNDMMSGVQTSEASLTTYESSQWWASNLGGLSVANQYELTYWDQWSELTLQFDSPFAEYKIFDYDFNEVTGTALESFWIWLTSWSDKGMVKMDPTLFNNPNAAAPESFIVFYDEQGNALAGICCKYTAAPAGGDSSTPISVKSGSAEVSIGLSSMGLPEGALNQIISGLGVGSAQTEMLLMASSAEVEFTTNFSISQIFVLNGQGQMATPAGFSCYQSSGTEFKVTAASGTECILLFMDGAGNIPVVAYYSYY